MPACKNRISITKKNIMLILVSLYLINTSIFFGTPKKKKKILFKVLYLSYVLCIREVNPDLLCV